MGNIKEVYTDGSGTAKKGLHPGGWSFCVAKGSKNVIDHIDRGYSPRTTHNRMELMAVVNSLYYCYAVYDDIKKVIIYTDSQYVSNSIFYHWAKPYLDTGVRDDGSEVKNVDIWRSYYTIVKRYERRGIEVDVRWIRGHNGNYFNEVVDKWSRDGKKEKRINKLYENI